jgi:hypothetical protein
VQIGCFQKQSFRLRPAKPLALPTPRAIAFLSLGKRGSPSRDRAVPQIPPRSPIRHCILASCIRLALGRVCCTRGPLDGQRPGWKSRHHSRRHKDALLRSSSRLWLPIRAPPRPFLKSNGNKLRKSLGATPLVTSASSIPPSTAPIDP